MLIYKDGIVADYREIFKNTSFTANGPNDEFLTDNAAYKVNTWIAHDGTTHKLMQCEPYIQDGWAYTVRVEAKSVDEIIADSIAKMTKIRAERNRRLSDCDWTQLADAQVDKDAWAVYRQALRDVPSQDGFPDTIVWPEKP